MVPVSNITEDIQSIQLVDIDSGIHHRLHQPLAVLLLRLDSWLSGSGNVLLPPSVMWTCLFRIL